MHRTAYVSGRKLTMLRRALARETSTENARLIARPDTPGPGAYVSNLETRARARGLEAELRCALLATADETI